MGCLLVSLKALKQSQQNKVNRKHPQIETKRLLLRVQGD